MDSSHENDGTSGQSSSADACQSFKEALLEREAHRDVLASHAARCAACAQFEKRFAFREAELARIERLSAPQELEGRVVAALEAGARQQRAVEALLGISRLKPPVELDGAVLAVASDRGRHAAPAVLERLVSEELSDPAKARTRRFVGSLRRFHAPRALAQRLSRDLVTVRASDSRPLRVVAWVGLAAVALIALATPLVIERALQTGKRPYLVKHVDANASKSLLGSLNPAAHDLLDSAGGGILSANKM